MYTNYYNSFCRSNSMLAIRLLMVAKSDWPKLKLLLLDRYLASMHINTPQSGLFCLLWNILTS